jgi:hypothetical protein
MRLWTIHPKYLDCKGLVALWREALLAKKVLKNRTKGYKNHPQLMRFKAQKSAVNAINAYLKKVFEESRDRCFKFDSLKIGKVKKTVKIPVSSGQIKFEFNHLLNKLKTRDAGRYKLLKNTKRIGLHPLFRRVSGKIEEWEKQRKQ